MWQRRTVLIIILIIACTAPHCSFGWGGAIHKVISEAAGQNVPDEMAAWRAYAPLLGQHGVDPDSWKGDDKKEPPRHFIDLENYGTPPFDLPLNMADITSVDGYEKDGYAPWVIIEAYEDLVETMRKGDWYNAARIAAALGHYVGDTHQPLHTTINYDGQLTGNRGVHLRWEVHMPKRIGSAAFEINAGPAVYMPDIWAAINNWIMDSHPYCKPIFLADKDARWASKNNVDSQYYYLQLWEKSQDVFLRQTSKSATDLSSLWYSAWVDAGKPKIPPPPNQISSTSIFLERSSAKQKSKEDTRGAMVVLTVIFGIGFVIVGAGIRQQRKAKNKPSDKE